MKRSLKVSLVLLGGVAGTAMLSGCEPRPALPPDNGGTFTSKAECVAVYDQSTCDAAQKLANQQHWQNAPHYSSYEQCVAAYGPQGCASGSTYGGQNNVFVPLMLGYMMGSANSSPAPLYYGPGAYRHRNDTGFSAPIYTSGRGYARNAPIGSAPFSSVRTTQGSLKSTTALTSTRGGFGNSFKPTTAFKSNYAATNPTSFGRSPATSGRAFSSTGVGRGGSSISARGGFGGSAHGFGGGGG